MVAGYFLSFLLAAVLVVASARWCHTVGRLVLGGVFLLSGALTLGLGLARPQLFVETFGPGAELRYQAFIEGPFAANPMVYLVPIALGQLVCGLAVALGRANVARLGLLGCIVFLVALSGLGVGCGFPANLVMALGAALLFRQRFAHGALHGLRLWHHGGGQVPAGR